MAFGGLVLLPEEFGPRQHSEKQKTYSIWLLSVSRWLFRITFFRPLRTNLINSDGFFRMSVICRFLELTDTRISAYGPPVSSVAMSGEVDRKMLKVCRENSSQGRKIVLYNWPHYHKRIHSTRMMSTARILTADKH